MRWTSSIGQGLVIAAALAVAACAEAPAASRDDGPAMAVERGDLVRSVLLTGELAAEDAVYLTTPNANIWPMQLRWIAEDGAAVTAGDPLAEFDNSQLLSSIAEMEATVVESENALAAAVARLGSAAAEAAFELEQARANLEKARMRADVPRELFSAREYEERQVERRRKELELEEASARRDSASKAGEAEVDLLRLNLERSMRRLRVAYDRIDFLDLRAARDGLFIRAINRQEGRVFQPGDSAWPGSPVGSLPDLSTLMVEARLYDVDDGRVVAGQPVIAVLDAFPDQTYRGTVHAVDLIAQEESGRTQRRTFRVAVVLETIEPERMRPGMSVKLEVRDEPLRDVLLAARAALDWSGGTPRLRTTEGWREVDLGPCDAFRCVVTRGADEGLVLLPARGAA